jgi:hypothetical protein
VSPIFKSGEKCLPTNYRPISVLPVISKLMEKHISRHMYQYLAKYNLLHDAVKGDAINGALTFRIIGPMLSVPVDLFMSRCKRSCSNSFIFTGDIANCVF